MSLIETLFESSLAVQRRTRASNGQGGWTETWATASTIAARMRPASASERTLAVQRQAQITHVCYCAADEDVTRGDQLSGEGRTYTVVAVREPSHVGHHLEIDCLETQKGGEP